MKKLDVYKIDVDLEDESGIKAMSLVTKPAIESNFLKFGENKKPAKVVALKNEDGKYKQVLAGLALVPDKMMYRYDETNEYEYFVYFDSEGIEKIRDKFHKEKNTDLVNLQHSDEQVDAYLIESYIINSPERLEEVKSQGIDEAVLGAWYVQYKLVDADAFADALDGEINGFSIEIQGNYSLEGIVNLNKNNNKNQLKIMAKFNELVNRFKKVLEEFEEVAEVSAKIADTETTVIYTSVGEPVYTLVPAEEEDGEPTRELATEGTYILDNSNSIVVDESGNLVEIKEDEAPVEPVNEEELEETAPVVPAPVVEVETAPAEETATEMVVDGIEALIPKDENGEMLDGSYSVEVYVNNGVITWGTMNAYTYKDLELAQKSVKTLTAEVAKLKAEPMVAPVKVIKTITGTSKLTKQEIAKMSNVDYQLHKLGLNK